MRFAAILVCMSVVQVAVGASGVFTQLWETEFEGMTIATCDIAGNWVYTGDTDCEVGFHCEIVAYELSGTGHPNWTHRTDLTLANQVWAAPDNSAVFTVSTAYSTECSVVVSKLDSVKGKVIWSDTIKEATDRGAPGPAPLSALSNDGNWLVVAYQKIVQHGTSGDIFGCAVLMYSATSSKVQYTTLYEHMGHDTIITSVAFSPDSAFVTFSYNNTVLVYNVATGKQHNNAVGAFLPTDVAVAPGGDFVAVTSDQSVVVYATNSTGQYVESYNVYPNESMVFASERVAFSDSGKDLVVAWSDGANYEQNAVSWMDPTSGVPIWTYWYPRVKSKYWDVITDLDMITLANGTVVAIVASMGDGTLHSAPTVNIFSREAGLVGSWIAAGMGSTLSVDVSVQENTIYACVTNLDEHPYVDGPNAGQGDLYAFTLAL